MVGKRAGIRKQRSHPPELETELSRELGEILRGERRPAEMSARLLEHLRQECAEGDPTAAECGPPGPVSALDPRLARLSRLLYACYRLYDSPPFALSGGPPQMSSQQYVGLLADLASLQGMIDERSAPSAGSAIEGIKSSPERAAKNRKKRSPGRFAGQFSMADDFDAPLPAEEFGVFGS